MNKERWDTEEGHLPTLRGPESKEREDHGWRKYFNSVSSPTRQYTPKIEQKAGET